MEISAATYGKQYGVPQKPKKELPRDVAIIHLTIHPTIHPKKMKILIH